MDLTANVRSIEVLQKMASVLQSFANEATVALEDLGMDMHRALQWVQHEQKEYWTQEMRRAEEALAEAKLNLERRKMYRVGGHEPSCTEERMALEAAKRKLQVARDKLEAVRRWTRLLAHESMECKSGVAPLSHWLQTDVPRALLLLRQMTKALELYISVASSAQTSPAVQSAATAVELAAQAWDQPAPPQAEQHPEAGQGAAAEET